MLIQLLLGAGKSLKRQGKFMNIVVTGASCMIGRELIQQLLRLNNNVTAVLHSENGSLRINDSAYKEIVVPMEVYSSHSDLLENQDVLFHFAWNGTRGAARDDLDLQKKSYDASMQLLNIAATCKNGPEKVFLAGSQAEYGKLAQEEKISLSEEMECNPKAEYGKVKLALYKDAKRTFSDSFCLIEPRYFSTYGVGDRKDTLLSYCIPRLLENKECEFGACTQLWNFIHASDTAGALIALMNTDVEPGVYNVASNDTRPLKEFLIEIKTLLSSTSELYFASMDISASPVMELNPNIQKLIDATNWMPRIPFKEGVMELIEQGVYN